MQIDPPGGDASVPPPPPDRQPGDSWSLDSVEPSAASTPETPPRRGRRRAIVAVIVAVAVVAGGTAAAGFLGMRGSSEELLGKIPADADVVAVAYLDPSAGQKANLFRMASRFPGLSDPAGLSRQVDDALDAALESLGLDQRDVGWVGVEVAVFVDLRQEQDPAVGVLADSDDDAGARDALRRLQDKRSSDGTTWRTADHDGVAITSPTDAGSTAPAFAQFDGTVVLGTTEDVVASVIDTSRGSHQAIRDDATFADTLAQLPSGKLGMVYANVQPILGLMQDSLGATGALGAPDLLTGDVAAIRSAALTISAEPDGLAMDSVTLYDDTKLTPESRDALSAPDHANPLLEMVPADAYGAFAIEHVDRSLSASLDQLETADPGVADALERAGVTGPDGLIAHMTGDVAVEAAPDGASTQPAAAVLVGIDDPGAVHGTLDSLFGSLPLGATSYRLTPKGELRERHEDVVWKTETHHGTEITYASSGATVQVAYAVVGHAAVVATSPTHLERLVDLAAGGSGLADDAGYRAAIEGMPSSDAVLYVDVARIVAAVRAQLDPTSRAQFDDQVGPNLDPIRSLVLGAEGDATSQRTRLLVRIP